MKIPETGLSKEQILETLQSYKAGDLDWRSGKTFGFIYYSNSEADDVLKQAYSLYLTENGLDPLSFPSLLRMENEVVGMMRDLLRGDEKTQGNFTSGGTESIMMAVLSARNRARAKQPHIKEPEMILPFTAHAAFYKACHYLGVKPVTTPVHDDTFLADVGAMRAAITENTILLAGSAPGYAHGVIDPIEEIGKLALEKDLLFHVDGCVGGIHLSYMRKLGMPLPDFDLSVPGVTSLSVDFHKYGYSAKNASMILYKSKELRRFQIFACARWPGYSVVNPTAGSSKTGGPLAAAWAILRFMGDEGYKKIVSEVQGATELLIDGVSKIDGLAVNGKPDMCMFSFRSEDPRINVYRLADEMKLRGGWYLQPQFTRENSKSNLHVSMTYINVPAAQAMLDDLSAVVETLRNEPPKPAGMDFAALAKNIDLNMDEAMFMNMLQMIGVTPDSPPSRMEDVNTILESLPSELQEFILITYLNNIEKAV